MAFHLAKSFFLSFSSPPPSIFESSPFFSIPYVMGISNKISKILGKKGIRVAFKPLSTLTDFVPPIKDRRDTFLDSGVYKVMCSCGTPYIGETGRSFNTRIREHATDIKHERVLKSALAEHSSSTKHHIFLEKMQIMYKKTTSLKENSRKPLSSTITRPTSIVMKDGA